MQCGGHQFESGRVHRIMRRYFVIGLLGVIALLPAVSEARLSSAEAERQVREHFAHVPAMIDIARCESGFRQYADSGEVFRGGLNGKMFGVFQLHSDYHLEPASNMGLDITTLEGNLAYAKYLYENEGLTPWRPCLGSVSQISLASHQVETEGGQVDKPKEAALRKQIEELQRKVYLLQIELLKRKLAELGVSY